MGLDRYFGSGNIYVIDNNRSEAEPVIKALYENQLPHIYMDGSKKALPKSPRQVRLLFLDLNLKDSTNPMDEKSFKSMHASILNNLLANTSRSYVILIWSKQEDVYLKSFVDLFEDKKDSYGLNSKRPLSFIQLNKKEFFKSVQNEDTGEVSYQWIDGKDDELFELISSNLETNESFKVLSSWENVVAKSGSNAVDYLFDLVKGEEDKNVKEKLNRIVTSLSISYLGKTFFTANDQEKTDAFMLALSELIDDEIDKEIILNEQPEFKAWDTSKRLDRADKGRINTKLLTSIENEKNELTGSILKADWKRHDFRKMLFECFVKDRKGVEKIINRKISEAKIENPNRDDKENALYSYVDELLGDQTLFVPIELNLTPLCDVVQNKEEYYRLVPGFLISSKIVDDCFVDNDRNFYSPLLFSTKGLDEYKLVLDYRYLHSVGYKDILKMSKMCSLRKSFVDDIQLKLSNHVSRLGLLYLS